MIAPDVETAIDRLRHSWISQRLFYLSPAQESRPSAASRISARREEFGPRYQPIPFDSFLASQEMRDESWRRRFAMEEHFAAAQPGRGHLALAALYRAGKVPAVITQNIDNLHQSSGVAAEDVVELHGNTTYAVCLDCAARYELVLGEEQIRVRKAARPIAPLAAAISRPRPSRSVRRCRRPPCVAPSNSLCLAIFFSQSALRSWFGRPPGFPCSPNAAARRSSSSIAIRPSSTTSPIL